MNALVRPISATAASHSDLRVIVIGGGIGGLALAQGLKKAGVGVSVYERDRTRTDRVQGYRVHINPAGSRALHACLPPHLFEAFTRTCGKPSRGIRFLTERGDVLLSLGMSTLDAMSGDDINRHRSVSRITLRQVLLSGLDDTVHFGKAFTRYEELAGGRIAAQFEDGTTAEGDVLVAADGGGSRVRRQFLPHAERIDTGIVGIAGKIFLDDAARKRIAPVLLDGLALVSARGGLGLFVALQEPGSPEASGIGGNDESAASGGHFDNTRPYLMWALSGRREVLGLDGSADTHDGERLRAIALRIMGGWSENFKDLVSLADSNTMSVIAIRTSLPVSPWPSGRITLLGDAIHSMTPFRGIGANVALKDAARLHDALVAAHRGESEVIDAIHAYEADMVRYGFAAVAASRRAMEQTLSQNEIGRAISRTAFRVIDRLPSVKRWMFQGMGDD
jgi:2-polyprenyl-6-methoxyphenol hydroxylase-like FAD-dependent oxidoreductase